MLRRDALRLGRTASVAALVSAPLPGASAIRARAHFVNAPDVVVFCDPALREPVRRAGALFRDRTDVPVRVISASGPLMAAQLARGERDDILISLLPIVRRLAASGLVMPAPFVGGWRNRVLIARKGDGTRFAPDALPTLLGGRKLGAPDPGPDAVVDTAALVDRLGLGRALAGRIAGEVDTGGVAWSLAHDRVGLGLMLATDAETGFSTAIAIPDDAYPPVRYAAAFGKHVLSRNADAFMHFLASGPARASLTGSGLEIEA